MHTRNATFNFKISLLGQVAIGDSDNQNSVVYNSVNGNPGVIVHTPGILSCEDFRTFWVATDVDTLFVGYGAELFEDEFMRFTGENVHYIHAMGLQESQFSNVEYEFFSIRGKSLNFEVIVLLCERKINFS